MSLDGIARRDFTRGVASFMAAIALSGMPIYAQNQGDESVRKRQAELDRAVKEELGRDANRYITRWLYGFPEGIPSVMRAYILKGGFSKRIVLNSEALTINSGSEDKPFITSYFTDAAFGKGTVNDNGQSVEIDQQERLRIVVRHEQNHAGMSNEGIDIDLDEKVIFFARESKVCLEDVRQLTKFGKSYEAFIFTLYKSREILKKLVDYIKNDLDVPNRQALDKKIAENDVAFRLLENSRIA